MEEYHYLDPKQLKLTDIPRNRSPFQDAIVFVVGGGNYIEYQNLADYAKVFLILFKFVCTDVFLIIYIVDSYPMCQLKLIND